jgi:hypothetical protein
MKTIAERSWKNPTAFLPNGCGAGWTSYLVPSEIGEIWFRDCCNRHDLEYHIGGFWGLLLRRPLADLILGRCVARRFEEAAYVTWNELEKRTSTMVLKAAGLFVAGQVVGLGYSLAVIALGWTPLTWPWKKRPVPTKVALKQIADVLKENGLQQGKIPPSVG